jgi:hypothetical protein
MNRRPRGAGAGHAGRADHSPSAARGVKERESLALARASRAAWLSLLLTAGACGSPFELAGELPDSGTEPDDAELDSAPPPPPEAGADHRETHPRHDAGEREAARQDSPPPPPEDSGHDAGHDAGCAPYPTTSVACPTGSPYAVTPGEYCVDFISVYPTSESSETYSTPPECQCASTYTCACLVASVGGDTSKLCSMGFNYNGCTVYGGTALLVSCRQP